MSFATRREFLKLSGGATVAIATLGGSPGAFAQDGDKPTIRVGAKNYTEQHMAAELLSLILQDAGYTVERQYGLAGTAILADAMLSGDLDVQVETTGTGMIMVGGSLPYEEAEEMTSEEIAEHAYSIAKEGYAEQFNIAWMEPFGYNGVWGMAVTQETAREHGLEKMSDLDGIAGDMTLGTDLEFPVRDDGMARFQEAYGFTFANMQSGDPGLMYQAIEQGDVDIITAYVTDGRVYSLDLVLLEDDKTYSLPYYATPLVRQGILDNDPELANIINQIGGEVTVREMADLTYEVDNNNASVEEVARAYLEEKGILNSGD